MVGLPDRVGGDAAVLGAVGPMKASADLCGRGQRPQPLLALTNQVDGRRAPLCRQPPEGDAPRLRERVEQSVDLGDDWMHSSLGNVELKSREEEAALDLEPDDVTARSDTGSGGSVAAPTCPENLR